MYGGKIIGQKESVHIDAVAGKVSSVNVESGSLTGNVTLAQPGSVSFTAKAGVVLNGKAFASDYTTEETGTVTEGI